ncbi:hypothetical protein TSMEX_007329 [Taenia solium]|eukprot:TsM_000547400 transcript=TsM_000547400 gene=TsM_000547400
MEALEGAHLILKYCGIDENEVKLAPSWRRPSVNVKSLHAINISGGGPDSMDQHFVDKMDAVSAVRILLDPIIFSTSTVVWILVSTLQRSLLGKLARWLQAICVLLQGSVQVRAC